MATTLKTKNSVTAASAPSSLAQGELAVNITDKKLWVGNAATTPVQLLGGGSDGNFSTLTVTGNTFLATSTGNVGIGNTSPSGKLHVTTSASALVALRLTDAANYTILGGYAASGVGYIGGDTGTSFALYSNGAELMRLNSATVGIGTNNPQARLGVVSANAKSVASTINISTFSSNDSQGSADLLLGVRQGGSATQSARWTGIQSYENGYGTQSLVLQDLGGNVGIGTSSPTQLLTVAGNGRFISGSGLRYLVVESGSTSSIQIGTDGTANYLYCTGAVPLSFATNASERMRITSAGFVGINTSSPTDQLSLNAGNFGLVVSGGGASQYINFRNAGGSTIQQIQYSDADGSLNIGGSGGGDYPIKLSRGGTERMRIGSYTNNAGVLIGTTTAFSSNAFTQMVQPTTDWWPLAMQSASRGIAMSMTGSEGYAIFFERATNSLAGYIYVNSNNTVSYATSSDYRLKENIAPMTGALGTVAKLKPVTYDWKAGGSSQGFIAHELQEVMPDAVTGKKDEMRIEKYEISPAIPATFDKEGNELTSAVEAVMGEREVPAYQGIDTSFLVATLTAAIQELNAKVTALEEQVITLSVK